MVTPATVHLDSLGETYRILTYTHNPATRGWGTEAAEALNLDPHAVFKTLIVKTDADEFLVAVVPVSTSLNLKLVADVAGAKKVVLAGVDEAERLTGYVVGGISPIGPRKQLRVFIDETAQLYDEIFVSGGRRGMDVGLSPQSLRAATDGHFVAIAS